MIYVFGGTNIDIVVKISDKIRYHESNPADISWQAGGVGRNIARAIGNYKECEFITVFPNSLYLDIEKDLLNHRISLNYSIHLESSSNSLYIDIEDKDGFTLGASDMKAIEKLKKEDVKGVLDLIKDTDLVVIDANISYEVIKELIKTKAYKVLDAVSSKKLQKIRDLTLCFDLIKVNTYEYEIIKDLPLKKVILTIGDGIIIKENQKDIFEIKHKYFNPISTSGCGDTFLGTYLANLDRGEEEAIKEGIVAAIATSQVLSSIATKEEIAKVNRDDLNIQIRHLL